MAANWSHALCTERERLLWARASVFSEGLDLHAAEAVCAGNGIDRDEVVDLVIALMGKSVFTREERPSGVRYRLLETIRQYGHERLVSSGEEAEVRGRHRDYYRRLAAEARVRLLTPSETEWYVRLEAEHANLRTALEHCFTGEAGAEAGLEMATNLLWHWMNNYHYREGRLALARGLAMVGNAGVVRANALWAGGLLAIVHGDVTSAEKMLAESRIIAEKLNLTSTIAYVDLFCGMIASDRGQIETAVAHYEAAADGHRSVEDPYGEALALSRLCIALSTVGRTARAVTIGERCLALCRARGDGWAGSYARAALGVAVWRQGDTRRAADLEQESLRLNRGVNVALISGLNVEVLAWIAATEGRYQRAATLFGILKNIWKAIGGRTILPVFGHLIPYHDECEGHVRQALGERSFLTAVEQGARLSFDEGFAFALQEPVPAREGSRDTAHHPPLTRREMEIARLVARGMSNKEIAGSLVIAQRTAEGHVENILAKLGVNSRTQIAAWLGEQPGGVM